MPSTALSKRAVQKIFAGTWLAYVGLYFCRKNFSVLMPLLGKDLHFSKDDLAALIFAYSLAYCLGQFVSGALADAVGARWVVACGMALSIACALGMAGAPGLGPGFAVFFVLQVLNGVAQSSGWPGLLKITATAFDPARRGVMMAWWSTNYVVGGFIATVVATSLVTGPLWPGLGWKRGALGPAAMLTVVLVVFVLLMRDYVAPKPLAANTAGAVSGAWREVLSSPQLWSIAVAYFCLKLMRYTFLFWLPLYMVEQLRYSTAEAGYTSSMYEVVGFVGVPLAGYVSDRVFGGKRFPVGAGMMFALAVVCFVFPALSAASRAGNMLVIGLAGALTFGPDSLMAGPATQEAVSAGSAATAGGFVNGMGSVGQLLSPFLVAGSVRAHGWSAVFSEFAVIAAVGGMALAVRWNKAPAAAFATA